MSPMAKARAPAEILIAPFSNSPIRNWPLGHFRDLVGLLVDALPDERIRIIGVRNQRSAASEVVRPFSALRVVNGCGGGSWADTVARVAAAMCLVGNNSGLCHLSAASGTPTVCVFGGSHQRREWAPRGKNVILLSRVIGCSPCQLDHGQSSPYGKACLRDIEPETVKDAVLRVMARSRAESARDEKELV